jgi:hypothetical protein
MLEDLNQIFRKTAKVLTLKRGHQGRLISISYIHGSSMAESYDYLKIPALYGNIIISD